MNTGRVVRRPQILDHVWDYDFGGESSVIETFMSHLRRKVDHVEPKLIRHVGRGCGRGVRALLPRRCVALAPSRRLGPRPSIAQSIVEAHHGRIALDTAPDRGCRFTVTLPLTTPTPEGRVDH